MVRPLITRRGFLFSSKAMKKIGYYLAVVALWFISKPFEWPLQYARLWERFAQD